MTAPLPRAAARLVLVLALASCNKQGKVYSGRYLAERSDDGGKTWFNDEGGLAAKSGSTREGEEGDYSRRMFDAGVTLCNQSTVPDRSKVLVRGYSHVKEGKEAVTDAELRAKARFDTDCENYLAARK